MLLRRFSPPTAITKYQTHGIQTVRDLQRYIEPVLVGNVGDNSVDSYRVHAYKRQQPLYVPIAVTDATHICYLCGVARRP